MHYLLYECTQCPLARTASNARAYAEDIITRNAIYMHNSHCVYVAYASGGLLFDAHIIPHLLRNQHDQVSIVVIDRQYADVIEKVRHPDSIFATGSDFAQYIANNLSDPTHTTYHRCTYFDSMIKSQAATMAPNTHVETYWFANAQAYYQATQRIPELRGHIATWIDPATPIEETDPYADDDAQYIPQSLQDRSIDHILTVNNDDEPTMITHAREHTIVQQQYYNIATHQEKIIPYWNNQPVYPYDRIPGAVQTHDTIYEPGPGQHGVNLLYTLCSEHKLHKMCIPKHTRSELDRIAVHT